MAAARERGAKPGAWGGGLQAADPTGRGLGPKIAGGFVLLSVAAALLPMRRYVARLDHDGFVLWAAALAWVLTLPVAFVLALRLLRRWSGRSSSPPLANDAAAVPCPGDPHPEKQRWNPMENEASVPEASWRCGHCGHTLTAPQPPAECPSCRQRCEFLNVTCYTPECAFQGADPRLR